MTPSNAKAVALIDRWPQLACERALVLWVRRAAAKPISPKSGARSGAGAEPRCRQTSTSARVPQLLESGRAGRSKTRPAQRLDERGVVSSPQSGARAEGHRACSPRASPPAMGLRAAGPARRGSRRRRSSSWACPTTSCCAACWSSSSPTGRSPSTKRSSPIWWPACRARSKRRADPGRRDRPPGARGEGRGHPRLRRQGASG